MLARCGVGQAPITHRPGRAGHYGPCAHPQAWSKPRGEDSSRPLPPPPRCSAWLRTAPPPILSAARGGPGVTVLPHGSRSELVSFWASQTPPCWVRGARGPPPSMPRMGVRGAPRTPGRTPGTPHALPAQSRPPAPGTTATRKVPPPWAPRGSNSPGVPLTCLTGAEEALKDVAVGKQDPQDHLGQDEPGCQQDSVCVGGQMPAKRGEQVLTAPCPAPGHVWAVGCTRAETKLRGWRAVAWGRPPAPVPWGNAPASLSSGPL